MTRSGRWATQFAVLITLLAVAVVVVAACGGGDGNGYGASEPAADEPADESVAVTGGDSPEAELPGEQLFIANCSMCHGAECIGDRSGTAARR